MIYIYIQVFTGKSCSYSYTQGPILMGTYYDVVKLYPVYETSTL